MVPSLTPRLALIAVRDLVAARLQMCCSFFSTEEKQNKSSAEETFLTEMGFMEHVFFTWSCNKIYRIFSGHGSLYLESGISCLSIPGISRFPLLLGDSQGPLIPSLEVSQTFKRLPAHRHTAWASYELSEAVTYLSWTITTCE